MTDKTVSPDDSVKIYSVSEISRLIKARLEASFPLVWVEGEISNFHRHQSGHLYFTLKDERSQIRAVMFRSDARRVAFDLEDGQLLVCRGRLNVYEPRGEYQLVADRIEPKGKGALQLAFEQLKEKLKKEGLFDSIHKKRLPVLPKKVGLVTSPRGAAVIDILRTLERRFARLHIQIYPVKVQGEGAAEEIVEGLSYLGSRGDIDVIIVGRGGGSMEDLWAFNEEIVARAIFQCPVPVISAVGHEIDFTIADFIADIRASTPSAAAEMVVETEQTFFDKIDNALRRMGHQVRYRLQEGKSLVLGLFHHKAFQNFKMRLLNMEQKIDDLETRSGNIIREKRREIAESRAEALMIEQRIIHQIRRRLGDLQGRWERLSTELNGLSPLNILRKGYSLCWKKETGNPVLGISQVSSGDELAVSFYKGEFECTVSRIDPDKKADFRIKEET